MYVLNFDVAHKEPWNLLINRHHGFQIQDVILPFDAEMALNVLNLWEV